MKLWPLFVLVTVFCWGAYVPILHAGQVAFGGKNTALRAFMCVGAAYFVMSILVLVWILFARAEPLEVTRRGMTLSTLAGVLGALGALGIVFAMVNGGRPIVVAPVVFAGAPIVNTIVSMMWHKPGSPPSPLFYAGIALAAVGASMVLRFKPV
jgi:hypothetical protein